MLQRQKRHGLCLLTTGLVEKASLGRLRFAEATVHRGYSTAEMTCTPGMELSTGMFAQGWVRWLSRLDLSQLHFKERAHRWKLKDSSMLKVA